MSLTTTNVKNEYTVVASTSAFAFTFRWFSLDEIEVYQDGALLVKDTDYTFSGTTSTQTGGQVDITSPMTTGVLLIKRVTPVVQEADYGTTTVFPATTSQGVDDRAVAMIQEIVDVTVSTPEFPAASADKFLGWNAAGTALENKTVIDDAKYAQLDTDVTQALADSATAIADSATALSTANTAKSTADGASATAVDAKTLSETNETNLALTEAKAASALLLATNNETAIAGIDTTVFMDKATYETRLDDVETESAATKGKADSNISDIVDVKSDIVDIQETLDSFTTRNEQYIGNNVLIATALNGMVFDQVELPYAYVTLHLNRSTDDYSTTATIKLYCHWDSVNTIWKVSRLSTHLDSLDGVTFEMSTVSTVGTLEYKSDDITGLNYDGQAYYRADKLLS